MFSGYIYLMYVIVAVLLLLYTIAIILYFKKYKNTKIKKLYKRVIILLALPLCYISVILISLAIALSAVDTTLQGFSSLLNVINNDNDCTCYAKCTNNPDTDSECTYKLIFGDIEYDNLIDSLHLDDTELGGFYELTSGSEKNTFIMEKLTDQSIDCYRGALKEIPEFRSDGLDRENISDDVLKKDLMKLLSDYKINGRNPKCDCCNIANVKELSKECHGEKHFIAGWIWEENWDSDDNSNSEYTPGGFELGNASGQYVITMEDGLSYYWYHQTSGNCGCVHCGDWTQMQWGVDGNWHKFGTDGCAVYSLAMIVSNLIGAEITPTKLLSDFGCSIGNGYCDTSTSPCFSGRNIIREAAIERIKQVYGIEYAFINNSAEANDILSGNGMVWDQWREKHTFGDFYWYGGQGHFMAIRELVDNKYYCLTSCGSNGRGSFEIMNYGETPENVFDHRSGGKTIGFWVENNTESGGQTGETNSINPVPEIVDTNIQKDIDAGLYTLEDYNYLVALGGESNTYNGFYAVACCVRNRVERNGTSYKIEVTKPKQFSGYHSSEVGNPRNDSVKKAAIAVLRGGESTIGDCYFFFGRSPRGSYDMWAEPDIDKFYNVGNNIYYNTYGKLHNEKNNKTPGAIIIYDSTTGTWNYPSGTYYTKE